MKLWRVVAGVLVAGFVAAGVTPAWACACGGYLPDAQSRARAFGENALVQHDAGTEKITLSMAINGSSKKAAWIMPVPAAAKVELGDDDVFYRLDRMTRPKTVIRKTYWPFRDLGIMGEWRLPCRCGAGCRGQRAAADGARAVPGRAARRLERIRGDGLAPHERVRRTGHAGREPHAVPDGEVGDRRREARAAAGRREPEWGDAAVAADVRVGPDRVPDAAEQGRDPPRRRSPCTSRPRIASTPPSCRTRT